MPLMQVQEQTDLTAQVQADLGQERQCGQHLKDRLQVRRQHCVVKSPALYNLGMLYSHS